MCTCPKDLTIHSDGFNILNHYPNTNILVLAGLVMCLTGACEENEFPDWARPATCAAIAITALVFFSLMYFGKSCSESRVKVGKSVKN